MNKYTMLVLAAVILVACAVVQADTVVRKSGETLRGDITLSGEFLEVKTRDGRFIMLRKGDVQRAVTSDNRVLIDNRSPKKKKQEQKSEKTKKKYTGRAPGARVGEESSRRDFHLRRHGGIAR